MCSALCHSATRMSSVDAVSSRTSCCRPAMSSSFRSRIWAAALGLVAVPALPADFEFQPRVEVQALHDDNYRLTDEPGAEIEVTGGLLDVELAFRAADPRTVTEIL